MRHGSRTETTQPIINNETCVELRFIGFDETAILTGARLSAA